MLCKTNLRLVLSRALAFKILRRLRPHRFSVRQSTRSCPRRLQVHSLLASKSAAWHQAIEQLLQLPPRLQEWQRLILWLKRRSNNAIVFLLHRR
jgi:hypothetical protein